MRSRDYRSQPLVVSSGFSFPAPHSEFRTQTRWVVKQNHGWSTPGNRRGSTFPNDQPSLKLRLGGPASTWRPRHKLEVFACRAGKTMVDRQDIMSSILLSH